MLRTFLLAIFLLSGILVVAQKPKPKTTVVKGFKPPKLKCSLGNYADSATITVQEGLAVIGTPLKISDAKNTPYTISSYQFLYRKFGVSEEENEDGPTGKTKPTYTISADLFKTTPLPQIWLTNVSDQLKPGDELFFFDIVVKDNQQRLMFAPTLKLKIK